MLLQSNKYESAKMHACSSESSWIMNAIVCVLFTRSFVCKGNEELIRSGCSVLFFTTILSQSLNGIIFNRMCIFNELLLHPVTYG